MFVVVSRECYECGGDSAVVVFDCDPTKEDLEDFRVDCGHADCRVVKVFEIEDYGIMNDVPKIDGLK